MKSAAHPLQAHGPRPTSFWLHTEGDAGNQAAKGLAPIRSNREHTRPGCGLARIRKDRIKTPSSNRMAVPFAQEA
jgi:hypothetical protein